MSLSDPLLAVPGKPEAEAAREAEVPMCIICYETLEENEEIFQQPLCGCKLHETCWLGWVFSTSCDQLRCVRCQQPAAQTAIGLLFEESAEERRQLGTLLCSERGQELSDLSRRVVSADLDVEQFDATADVTAALRPQLNSIFILLFLYSQLSPNQPQCCLTGLTVPQHEWLVGAGTEDNVQMAALLWEQKPDLAARMLPVARLLQLHQGTEREAHYILGELYAGLRAKGRWEHSDKCLSHLGAALAEAHPRALAQLVPKLCEKLEGLFEEGSFDLCTHFVEMLSVRAEDPAPSDELVILTSDVGLIATFLRDLLKRAQADPCGSKRKLAWLHDAPQDTLKLDQLAAWLWEASPPGFPESKWLSSRRLRLEKGYMFAHLLLAGLYSTSAFEDPELAKSHLQRALSQREDVVRNRSDIALCKQLLELVLQLDEANPWAQEEIRRLRAKMNLNPGLGRRPWQETEEHRQDRLQRLGELQRPGETQRRRACGLPWRERGRGSGEEGG